MILVHCYYYSGDRSFQAQLLPGGRVIFETDWHERWATRAAEHHRHATTDHAEHDRRWDKCTIPTIR